MVYTQGNQRNGRVAQSNGYGVRIFLTIVLIVTEKPDVLTIVLFVDEVRPKLRIGGKIPGCTQVKAVRHALVIIAIAGRRHPVA